MLESKLLRIVSYKAIWNAKPSK